MVGTLPSNAAHACSISGQGPMIPHAAEKLSPCDAITEPETPVPCNEPSHTMQGRS